MVEEERDPPAPLARPAEAAGQAPAPVEASRVALEALRRDAVVLVRPTPQGVAVRVFGASLVVRAEGPLACASVRLRAARDLTVAVGGELRERVGGSATREAAQRARVVARQVAIEATVGGVSVRANDDVSLRGESIRLNSPEPPAPRAEPPAPLPRRGPVAVELPVPPEIAPPSPRRR